MTDKISDLIHQKHVELLMRCQQFNSNPNISFKLHLSYDGRCQSLWIYCIENDEYILDCRLYLDMNTFCRDKHSYLSPIEMFERANTLLDEFYEKYSKSA